jgi:hypothetical protein
LSICSEPRQTISNPEWYKLRAAARRWLQWTGGAQYAAAEVR